MALRPLERLQREYELQKDSAETKLKKAQEQCEQCRRSLDSLNRASKDIDSWDEHCGISHDKSWNFDSYNRNKRGNALQECRDSINACEEVIKDHEASIATTRKSLSTIEKEIHESDSFLANLRENERARKLRRDIAANKDKIAAFDMEEAARARRQFDEKYATEKKREGDMEAEVSIPYRLKPCLQWRNT